ncbi:MAG: glycosyltransferase family 9 protein [Burkholderiales bacterium]
MKSRWLTRAICVGLAFWYAILRAGRRRPSLLPRRILVAHNLLLGDTIMLAPLLKKLRQRYPDAQIIMTCTPGLVSLFANRPYGVQAVGFDSRDVQTFFALFRNRGFDLALLPADNRLGWLARALDARWIVGFAGDRPAYKNRLADEVRIFGDQPMALGDLMAARLVDGEPPAPYAISDWRAPPAEPFSAPQAPYCVLHVGAGSRLRYWEPEKWRALIAHLEITGIRPVLTTGPGEETLIPQIDPQGKCLAFSGNLSLAQMWRLLAGALAVVCPDTGIAHLARIAGSPSVVLFGPGSATLVSGGEFWRNIPGRKVTIPKFPCRDENMLFRRHLPWAEHCGRSTAQCASPKCMHALTDEMVIQALDSLLKKTKLVIT